MKITTLLSLAALLLSSSCTFNIFDPIDGPGDDPDQLLSAARACFDNGDFECAAEFYGKLEGTTYGEQAAAEQAFAILDQNGAGMKAFMKALGGGGGGGAALTKMTNALLEEGGGSEARRLAIYEAYRQVDLIPNNAALRGLVRFIAAFATLAEMLAEEAGSDGVFAASDLVTNPGGCTSVVAAGCNPPGSPVIQASAATPDFITSPAPTASVGGLNTANWASFNSLITAISHALSNEIGAGGSFSSVSDFSTAVSGFGTNDQQTYRFALISNGVGNE